MNRGKRAAIAVIVGIVITLATSITPSLHQMLSPGIGATGLGFPFTWLYSHAGSTMVNYWSLGYTGLAANLVFWFLVIYILLSVFKPQQGAPRAVRRPRGGGRARRAR